MTSTTGEYNAGESKIRFDVREFARTARGNHRDELGLQGYADARLGLETLRALRYLGRLEGATMEQLRNLLVTATHKDARVTAFLVTWAFEKFWIADAIDVILEANGEPRLHEIAEGERRTGRSESIERRGPIRRAIAGIAQGVPIVGVHMTMGLVDEWTTQAAYRVVSEASGSVILSPTITMILAVKERHLDFFDDEARRRLADSPRSATLARSALVHTAWPLGSTDRDADERTFFESYVFGGEGGAARARAVGKLVAGLPGMNSSIGDTVANGIFS